VFCFLIINSVKAQIVYQDIYKATIYSYLDEMVNLQLIELNTAVKPYSRQLIAEKLNEIDTAKLNFRQKQELKFYLKDFNKELKPNKNFDKRLDLFYYKDSLFSLTFNPIGGVEINSNSKEMQWHTYSGAELFGSIGKHIGFYASLRDNLEKEITQNEQFLNRTQGANHKGTGDFSEMRGGINYSWEWGSVGLLKDNFTWGNNNFGANILSGKSPSFARLQLKLSPVKWMDFEYFHAWLASEVRDSSRSYLAGARLRKVDVSKFMAANIFTVKPIKGINVSIGNSIIYSDNLQPVFFIPFMFFKPLDHTTYAGSGNFGGGNSQFFLDISSRNIKGYHFYTSIFVDELSTERMFNPDKHSTFASLKLGAAKNNIYNKNISVRAEYTRSNPITYRHFVNSTTFESNNYNLGHYLRDNAQELALGLTFQPLSQFRFDVTYVVAQKGEVYEYSGEGREVWGLPFIEQEKWESSSLLFQASYELYNDLHFYANFQHRKVYGVNQGLYTYEYYQGNTNTITAGFSAGF